MNKILLLFVIIGGVNIVLLLLIKSKARKSKTNNKRAEIKQQSSIRVLNYEDEDLICMVENNLEMEYGYECTDKTIFKNMNKHHRTIYSLIWFDKEIVNGGLGEYFFGYSNITMEYIKEALEDIKAFDVLKKYRSFLEQNDVIEATESIKKRSVEEYSQFMSKFNFSEFNHFYNHKNIDDLIASYIRNNICDFSDLSKEEIMILKQIDEEAQL